MISWSFCGPRLLSMYNGDLCKRDRLTLWCIQIKLTGNSNLYLQDLNQIGEIKLGTLKIAQSATIVKMLPEEVIKKLF